MNKPTLDRCFRLLDCGFSLVTVNENKIPNIKWADLQKAPLTKEDFQKAYEKDTTQAIGIITGYADVEVIDIDLKVFSTAIERKVFFEEFIGLLRDNILDFYDKVAIYRTKNEGYHLIYKSKRVVINSKLAKLKGHSEAVIETRGKGGYAFLYDGNNQTELTYTDLNYISDEDREVIISTSRLFNYEEEEQRPQEMPKQDKTRHSTGLTPWDDYNNKNSIFDIIQPEIQIIKTLSKKYIVRRQGATSPHSGYVYRDSGCMFLFSTGTIYPHQKLISPFAAYAYKHHQGDFSEAAKAAYQLGYGDRIKVEAPPSAVKEVKQRPETSTFPVEIFPDPVKDYILECANKLSLSTDYMGCTFLFAMSLCIGNTFKIEVKKGWNESALLWLVLVGGAGIGKTPSIKPFLSPLLDMNGKYQKDYQKQKDKYNNYMKLSKDEKQMVEECHPPVKEQFIVNDTTLEAFIELHDENDTAIGVFKDELAGWVKEMNRYRQGGDLEQWLSIWSNMSISLNRKTATSNYVHRAYVPVLGGIQPNTLRSLLTEDFKDNGFIDRLLICFPDLKVEKYNENEIDERYIDWYESYITNIFKGIRKDWITRNSEDEIVPNIAEFSKEAKKEWARIFNEITDMQNSDETNEYLKSMLPKQKSYIPRFALILNILESIESGTDATSVSSSILKDAKKLSDYFVSMANKLNFESSEVKEIAQVLRNGKEITAFDKFKAIMESGVDASPSRVSELLGISRRSFYNYKKQYDEMQAMQKH